MILCIPLYLALASRHFFNSFLSVAEHQGLETNKECIISSSTSVLEVSFILIDLQQPSCDICPDILSSQCS